MMAFRLLVAVTILAFCLESALGQDMGQHAAGTYCENLILDECERDPNCFVYSQCQASCPKGTSCEPNDLCLEQKSEEDCTAQHCVWERQCGTSRARCDCQPHDDICSGLDREGCSVQDNCKWMLENDETGNCLVSNSECFNFQVSKVTASQILIT